MDWIPPAVDDDDRLTGVQRRRVVRRTARLLRPQSRRIVVALLMVLVWTGAMLAGPALVRYGIDQGIREDDGGALDRAVVAYLVVSAVSYVAFRAQILLISQAGEEFLRDLRIRLFHHLQRLSMPFYDREKAGVVVSRMTSDVDSLAELVQYGLLMFVANGLLLVGSLVLLVGLSPPLALVCLGTAVVVAVASVKFSRDSNEAYLEVRDGIGRTLSHLQEGIAGVRVVQAFVREQVQADRFRHRSRALYDAHVRSIAIQCWYVPLVEFAAYATTGVVVGYGGWLVSRGSLTIGTLAAFVLLLNNVFAPLEQLSQQLNTFQSAGASLHKIYGLLDTRVDVPERPGAVDLPPAGEVSVEGVSFAYEGGPPVLTGVDLVVRPGERLALVGPTGAGKSTLAKLIARLYDPTEGTVRFGGIDLRDATDRSLRERVVVVPQEGFLFNGTLLDNVRLSRSDATEEEVWAALDDIGVAARFRALPQGLATPVQERGSRFSAGEKQLVSLARAALVDPALLVLDEATSSLDPGTELLVEHALERLMAGRSVVVIAHRLSTAERADRVGVVVGGHLVELGSHDELVEAGGAYAALHAAWVGAGVGSAGASPAA
jgi:ATP-binding cassette subfamily B protein